MPDTSSTRRKKLSRREQRDLDIEIEFLEGLVRREPKYVEALQLLAGDYTQRGRFEDGLRIDQRLSRLCPNDPMVLYNLACSYALTGKIERAAATLERAIDRGYRDFRWLRRDPDLAALRTHPLYRKIQQKMRAMKVKVR